MRKDVISQIKIRFISEIRGRSFRKLRQMRISEQRSRKIDKTPEVFFLKKVFNDKISSRNDNAYCIFMMYLCSQET